MKRLLALCSIVVFFLFPVISCLAEGSKDMYPAGALGNGAYMTCSSTATSSAISITPAECSYMRKREK